MLIKIILFAPLLGALISGLFCRQISDKNAQKITSGFLILSALCSAIAFYKYGILNQQTNIHLLNWINSGDFHSAWSLKVDSLTATMLVVVTFVSSLVHVYSIGYMSEDKSIPRFQAYLSLFTFFMLVLVTSDNLLQLFVGWEGVGLASYLLIGFWYNKESANLAAMKAFIVNRIGDFGLIIAIAMIYFTFGTINFDQIFAQAANFKDHYSNFLGYNVHTLTLICILLFIGAMGKSAQIGLHTWLPDAMEGPTPVSALIHAATMVTAGVFLVIRCSHLFEYSPIALSMVTFVGAITAIFAATIAITQNDIKKVIAYSTCSQLGYMFFACGLGAYSAGLFHLMTHAFFKALLFLGAGSVIHALHHQQDMRKMGGIYKKIPVTYAMMWIGTLALIGFPPFAGYFSKDMILEVAYMSHAPFAKLAFYLGMFAAFLTAFYSFRLLFLVFHGKTRCDKRTFDHAHESPPIMLFPLLLLAVGAISSGMIGKAFYMISADGNFFSAAIFSLTNNEILREAHHTPFLIKKLPLILGFVAIYLAYILYLKKPHLPAKIATTFKIFYKISFNKWYFDEIYDRVFVANTRKIGHFLWQIVDIKIIDNLGPNGVANFCKKFSGRIAKLQNGLIYSYASYMVIGVLIFALYLIYYLKDLILL